MAYYVHPLASGKHGTLFYLGVTDDLVRRCDEHRTKAGAGFMARYDVSKLMWFEIHDEPLAPIAREKELKKWRRDWKIRLVEEQDPGWVDLFPGIPHERRDYGFRARCAFAHRAGMTQFLNSRAPSFITPGE